MMRYSTIIIILLVQLVASMESIDSFHFFDTCPLESGFNESSDAKISNDDVFPIDSAGQYWLQTLPLSIDSGAYLYLPPSPHGIQLYLNGYQIYRWGNGVESGCYANYDGEIVSLNQEFLKEDTNIITMALISDGARTTLPPMEIGTFDEVSKKAFWITLFNHSLIIVVIGIAVFVLFFLTFYLLFSITEIRSQTLFLALFCLSLILTYSMFLFNNYHFDQVLLFKIARVGSLCMSLTLLLYVTAVTKMLNGAIPRVILLIAYLPYLGLIVAGTTKFEINGVFFAASNTIIMPLLLVGFILLLIGLIRYRKLEIVFTFTAYIFLMVAVFSDVTYMIRFQQPLFWKIPYGYFVMILGGVASLIYQRSRTIENSIVNLEKISQEKSELQGGIDSDTHLIHSFVNSFTSISQLGELQFSQIESVMTDPFFPLFQYYRIYSQNMFYFDKIRRSELTLWYDAFNISKEINELDKAFSILAEESGVGLEQNYKMESFPPLLWSDQMAVLQVVANSLLLASVIEKDSITITIEYISYEGLLISLDGSDDGFSTDFLESLSTGFVNGKYSTEAVVLSELLSQLDSKYIVSFINPKVVVGTIPMSISEE